MKAVVPFPKPWGSGQSLGGVAKAVEGVAKALGAWPRPWGRGQGVGAWRRPWGRG